MGAPDPFAIELVEEYPGHIELWFDHGENPSSRQRRVLAILRRMKAGTWRCSWCGEPLPFYKRADAWFCGEQCKKRARDCVRLLRR